VYCKPACNTVLKRRSRSRPLKALCSAPFEIMKMTIKIDMVNKARAYLKGKNFEWEVIKKYTRRDNPGNCAKNHYDN
jgi:hypothetical protein